MAININKLGFRVDGWADLVEGVGDKEELAQKRLSQVVRWKKFPNTSINTALISPSYGRKKRRYLVVEMKNGATVAVYIGAFGRDLYAKWDVYVRPLPNKSVVFLLLIIGSLAGLAGSSAQDFYGNSHFSFWGFVGGFFTWVIGSTILISIAGFILRKNPLAFFLKQLDEFDMDDIGALTLATHKCVLHALDAIGIKTQTLRVKEHFSAGSRDRLI